MRKRSELERIDVAKAIDAFEGNQYMMILVAAHMARDITKRRDFLDRKAQKLHYYGYKPLNQALKDIIDESGL